MTSKARQLADLGGDTANLEEVSAAYGSGALSNRNLIINGAMQVAQRGTSAAGVTTAGYEAVDRFRFTVGSAGIGTYTISQDTDAPSGFGYSYKIDCTTADAAPDASDAVFIATRFEGQNLQSLKKGTADALPTTLSFWVKSNLTGTFQVNLRDIDNNRMLGATYAISSADTWEYKTITYVGDTSGVLDNNNGLSVQIEWALDGGTDYTSGSVPTAWETRNDADRAAGLTVNLADNTANYWQITGVQLEVGDTATPFEHRSYGQELALCQRYWWYLGQLNGVKQRFASHVMSNYNTTTAYISIAYPVQMRTAPSASESGSWVYYSNNNSFAVSDLAFQNIDQSGLQMYIVTSGLNQGGAGHLDSAADGGYIYFDAEL